MAIWENFENELLVRMHNLIARVVATLLFLISKY